MEVLALTIVGAHGLTDMVIGLTDTNMWLVYAFYAVLSRVLPLPVCGAGFILHSAAHFSADFGAIGGLLAAFVIPMCIVVFAGLETAVRAELAYLTLLHVPLHYARVWPRLASAPLTTAVVICGGHVVIAATIVARRIFLPPTLRSRPWYETLESYEARIMNAVVCAHVAYNFELGVWR